MNNPVPNFVIDQGLSLGLRPDSNNKRNRQFFINFKNLACTENGAKQLPAPYYPCVGQGDATQTNTWAAMRQFLRGENGVLLLADKTSLYTVNPATGVTTAVTPVDGAFGTTEALSNGGFTTDTLWQKGAGVTIDAGNNNLCTFTGVLAGAGVVQNYADEAIAIVPSSYYRVTYTIASMTVGGSVKAYVGTNYGTARTEAGTYTEIIKCSAAASPTFSILATATTTCTIDDVSCILLTADKTISYAATTTGWHIAAFQNYWVMTDGKSTMINLPSNIGSTVPAGSAQRVYAINANTNVLAINTCCNHDNRLVLGGLSGTYFSGSTWLEIFSAWRKSPQAGDYRDRIVMGQDDAWSTDFIAVSRPGGGDIGVPFAPFLAAFGIPDAYTYAKVKEAVMTDIESGEMVLYRMQYTGPVQRVMSLGDRLVVYGTRGVSVLSPSGQTWLEEKLLDVGVLGRMAAFGDALQHVWVGTDKMLYEYQRGQGFNKVGASPDSEGGYYEYMNLLTAANAVMSFDSEARFWWIADGVYCYLKTRTGVCQSQAIMPFSTVRIGDQASLIGTYFTTADVAALLETDTFDGGQTGECQILFTRIATTDTDATGWTAAAEWRVRKNEAFTTETAAAFDLRGVARTKQSGKEFRMKLAAADRTKVDAERIEFEMSSHTETKPDLSSLILR